ncbi:MAG: hypothetical protein ISS48_02160 [Candidatus Aenigmarchaeota archaeon]|nr:hypothetical protein [Candidatus Aenigmarchaeota archaeon]
MGEFQQILKPSKIVVFVDSRESSEVIKYLSDHDCMVIKKQLPVGDYLCSSIVGVERKSLASDTPVIVKVNGEIKIISIEEAYSHFKKGSKTKVMGIDFSSENIDWFEVYDMTLHESDVLYGISFSPKRKIKNENEKNICIKVTGGHNIYIFKNKKIECIPTSKLNVGDSLILVPPKLPEKKSLPYLSFEEYIKNIQSNSCKGYKIKKRFFKLNSGKHYYKIPEFNEDFFFILGLWTADGYLDKGGVSITQKDEERDKIIEGYLVKVFGNFSKSHGNYSCGGKLYHRLFKDIFKKSGAEHKHVPSIVLTATKELKTAFIRGYFFGDGWKNEIERKNPQLKTCSKSKKLTTGISYLLYSLGIENSVRISFQTYKNERRKYYELLVKTKSINKFIEVIGQIPTKEIRGKKGHSRKIPYFSKGNFYSPLLRLSEREVEEFYNFTVKLRVLHGYSKIYVEKLKKIIKKYPTKKDFSKKYGIHYSTIRNITNGYAKSSNIFLKLVNIIRLEEGLKSINIDFGKSKKILRKLNVSTYLTRFEKRDYKSETLVKNIYDAIEKKVGLDSIFLLKKVYDGDIFLRKISHIEKIKEKEKVYDFSVKGAENFVGGLEPILVHNTADDFINSIIDGRLFQQAEELIDNFTKPILIIEGNYFRESMNENAIKAALSSLILDYGISVLTTKDEEDTAKTIYWLAKKEQIESQRPIGIKGKKKPKDLKKLQEHIISGFPGVSTKISKRILEEFKTIKNFSNATEEQLIKIDGIGKALVKKLNKILNERYDD